MRGTACELALRLTSGLAFETGQHFALVSERRFGRRPTRGRVFRVIEDARWIGHLLSDLLSEKTLGLGEDRKRETPAFDLGLKLGQLFQKPHAGDASLR